MPVSVMKDMENQNKQKTQNEHYVPQCYLNAFAKKNGKEYRFFVFDKFKNEVRPGNVSKYASERYFYDVDFKKLLEMKKTENPDREIPLEQEQFANKVEEQYLEHFFGDYVEGTLFRSVSRIKTTFLLANPKMLYDMQVFTDEQMKQVAAYIMFQILRTKEERAFLNDLQEKNAKVLAKFTGLTKDIDSLADEVDVVWKGYDHKKLLHFQMIMDKEFQNTILAEIMNMIWIVGINETEMPFYTSDTAAIRKGYEGVSGFACRGLEITFPITPKLVLILREPEYFHKDAHLHNRFFRLPKYIVEYINELQVTRSYRYTFCIEDNFRLAKNLIRKYPDLQKIDYDRVLTT